jgi:phosphatidate phosphatase PAH1
MDIETLKTIEYETCTNLKKYIDTDPNGNIIAQWEKDADGNWCDLTDQILKEQELNKACEDFRRSAKSVGLSDDEVSELIGLVKQNYYNTKI